jgi:hypothetical protein
MTESAKGLKEAWIKLEGMRDGYKYAIHKLDALLPMTCENLRSSGLQTVPFEVE